MPKNFFFVFTCFFKIKLYICNSINNYYIKFSKFCGALKDFSVFL